MSNPSDVGKSITETIRFISRLGTECDHLADLIREELSRALLAPEIAKRYKAGGKWIIDYAMDEPGWVYTELASSLPVIVKPKRSTGGYLVVQISLAGFGIDAEDNQEPLLHIGWWNYPIDFDDVRMGFPLHVDTQYDLVLESDRLFRWVHTPSDSEWCYSLRLTDINNPVDVQKHIVAPIKALLQGADTSQALSNTTAVRYARIEGASGQYRVLPR